MRLSSDRLTACPSVRPPVCLSLFAQMDNIFLVFDYCAYDLSSLVERMSRPFLESEVKQIMLQLLEAVEYLHANFIVHRDLKLSNLLVDDKGRLKVRPWTRTRTRTRAWVRLEGARHRRHWQIWQIGGSESVTACRLAPHSSPSAHDPFFLQSLLIVCFSFSSSLPTSAWLASSPTRCTT